MITIQRILQGLALCALSPLSATAQIYLTSGLGETIDAVRMDGRGYRTLIDLDSALGGSAPYFNPFGITVAGSALYWIDGGADAVYSADLDGRNIRKLVDLGKVFGGSDYHDGGIAVSGSQLYWAHWSENRIYTAGIDGSNPRILVNTDATIGRHHQPLGVAVSSSHLFWTSITRDYKNVYTANLDGSNPRKLIDPAAVFGSNRSYLPQDITISGSALYWTDAWLDAICTADLSGRNPRILVNLQAAFGRPPNRSHYVPSGIAVTATQVMWTDRGARPGLYTANLDGSNPRVFLDIPSPAMNQPNYFAISPPTPPEIRHLRSLGTQLEIDFTGILQQSTDLRTWIDISPQPASPFRTDFTGPGRYFRARSQ